MYVWGYAAFYFCAISLTGSCLGEAQLQLACPAALPQFAMAGHGFLCGADLNMSYFPELSKTTDAANDAGDRVQVNGEWTSL